MKRILIVDDDKKTLSYLKEDLIKSYQFDVTYLESVDNVLLTLKGSRYDAVILDIMMPVSEKWSRDEQTNSEKGLSTGLILLKQIRAQFPKIPIVIYTAKKNLSVMDQYTVTLMKPEFNKVIVEHLNKLISHEN